MNKKKKIVRQVEGNRLAILRTLPLPVRYPCWQIGRLMYYLLSDKGFS